MNQRIQRKRTKGWRKPPNTVNVARPSVLGNPFTHKDPECAVELFRDLVFKEPHHLPNDLVARRIAMIQALWKMEPCDFMCWCPLDKPCHADVLIEAISREGAMKSGERFMLPGLNRAALMWRFLDGESPNDLATRFELSMHEVEDVLRRYSNIGRTGK